MDQLNGRREPVRFGVIADDLTGACELAGIARTQGLRSTVCLQQEQMTVPVNTVPVMHTDSRHCPPEESANRVRQAFASLRAAGCTRFYKKCDSVLRGNIGAELDALLTASGARRLIYGPAFPSAGRIVRGGRLLVDGVPVSQSPFADDPLAPVREDRPAAVVALQSGLRLTEAGPEGPFPDGGVVLVDGECNEDLARLAARSLDESCFAGPGAYFEALLSAAALPEEPVPAYTPPRAWLVVIGSQHPVCLDQLAALSAHGAECLQLLPEHVIGRNGASSMPSGWLDRVRRAQEETRCVVLHTARSVQDLERYRRAGAAAGLTGPEFSRCLTGRLVSAAAQLAADSAIGLLVCGGETAQHLAVQLGLNRFEALQAPSSGVTLLQGAGPGGERLLMTKNGAFGPHDLLVNLTETER